MISSWRLLIVFYRQIHSIFPCEDCGTHCGHWPVQTWMCVCLCVCMCVWTGEPLSALCANKTAALWDTGHPRSNSITLLKRYTPWMGHGPRAPVDGSACECVCVSSHVQDGEAVNGPMCVYSLRCQWFDSPFTICCLNPLSKCWCSHRSRPVGRILEYVKAWLVFSTTEHTHTVRDDCQHS